MLGEVELNTNDEIAGVALTEAVLTAALTLLEGLFTAESLQLTPTL